MHSKICYLSFIRITAHQLAFSLSGGTGLLLLCDVAVKPFVELTNAVRPLPLNIKTSSNLDSF